MGFTDFGFAVKASGIEESQQTIANGGNLDVERVRAGGTNGEEHVLI